MTHPPSPEAASAGGATSRTCVYYDGACPLCDAEIGLYSRADRNAALTFVDVSDPATAPPPGVAREAALKRFHVVSADGRTLSGARAFVEIWRRLPGWRLAARLADLPGVMPLMEGAYRLFLRLRPLLVRAFVAVSRRRQASAR